MENNQKELMLLKDLGMIYPNQNSKRKRRYGLFKCFCGNEFKATSQHIKSGHTKSCGCLNIKHNFTNHKLYNTWYLMIYRCTNPKSKNYKNYGDRGITVCERWNNFISFLQDMENSYKDNLTLDRIDVNGNYEPLNCRWANKTTQNRNTRILQTNNTSGYRGVYFNKKSNSWKSQISINNRQRSLGYFKTALDGALAYDNYIIKHNLEHTKNF